LFPLEVENGKTLAAGNVRPERPFCAFHDPELASRRAAGRRAGGRKRARGVVVLPMDGADLPLRNIGDVVELLAASVNQVRKGQLDAKVANAVGYLASVLLRALTEADVEQRLAALEAALKVRGNGKSFSTSRPA
jgi:hypothetical protein